MVEQPRVSSLQLLEVLVGAGNAPPKTFIPIEYPFDQALVEHPKYLRQFIPPEFTKVIYPSTELGIE